MLIKKNNYTNYQHPFHIVNRSFWPIFFAFSLLNLLSAVTLYLNWFIFLEISFTFPVTRLEFCVNPVTLTFIVWLSVYYFWFKDILTESTFQGNHTKKVQSGIYLGMLLFILSEMMFFFSFFWAFFHCSLSPGIFIGCVWPPEAIQLINPWNLPLWNTFILLSSGLTVTSCHESLLASNRYLALEGLLWTALYGVLFSAVQLFEYRFSPYSINDGVFGSIFFMLTGFHALHVLIGTTFLLVCFYRMVHYHFTRAHHVGLEAAIVYWHMVDAVWLFLFLFMYVWGGWR